MDRETRARGAPLRSSTRYGGTIGRAGQFAKRDGGARGLHRLSNEPEKFPVLGGNANDKTNHDLLRDVLDELCVTPIYTAACARCGISTKSLWRYVRASQCEDDPESYRLVWCDVEDWFHGHLKQAMRMSALLIEATARHHALHGFDEVQIFQGQVCWKEDPKLAGLSDAHLPGSERQIDMSVILTALWSRSPCGASPATNWS